jgi:mannose-1-phosphate guanylyltransferase/mannose-6-phosphate isomerase
VPDLRPVILSGGAGTRLWPLSTPDVPKQFTPLFGADSLFALTLRRLEAIPDLDGVVVVTGERFVPLVDRELAPTPLDVSLLVEPEPRSTAPAAIAAARMSRPEDVILLLPADHLIADVVGFAKAIAVAADVATKGLIVTFGIIPSRPETGYGYMEKGEPDGAVHVVARFKEKPDEAEAVEMAGDGRHLWNSGMFVACAETILEEAAKLCPDVLDAVTRSLPTGSSTVTRLGEAFKSAPSISFDHAIMEHTQVARVLDVDFGWSDVGSYDSLLQASERDAAGNHTSGDVTLSDVTGSYVKATSREVVVAGLDEVVVVETPDAVLVLPLDRAQDVRDLQRRVIGD